MPPILRAVYSKHCGQYWLRGALYVATTVGKTHTLQICVSKIWADLSKTQKCVRVLLE